VYSQDLPDQIQHSSETHDDGSVESESKVSSELLFIAPQCTFALFRSAQHLCYAVLFLFFVLTLLAKFQTLVPLFIFYSIISSLM